MLRWIPNLISLARIALVPMVVASIESERFTLGVSLFFVAGFSDGIDGWLARRFDWRTQIGAILDPIADKLLLIGTFIVMALVGVTPWWLAALVVLRDLTIMGGAIAYHFLYGDLEGKPSLVSKLNTVLMLAYVFLALLDAAYPELASSILTSTLAPLVLPALMAALITTMLVSTLGYMLEWTRRAGEHNA
ncbi:MAG: CDP-alcohol phosphatidyltransferase family protein [Pseudomonadota bacterium]